MDDEGASPALLATIRGLIVDQAAGEVIAAFHNHGVRAILLKGASFARWLYDDGAARPYVDVDLLVPPDQLAAAGEVLGALGYELRCAGAAVGEQADHATNWDRPGSPTVDLHNTLSGRVGAAPARCWEVVAAQAQPAKVGGSRAEVLAPAALALHVVLHAEAAKQKTLDDLSRALCRLDLADWQAALDLATALDALPAFGVGLRLLPEGQVMATTLGVPTETTVELVLQTSSTGSLAYPFDRVARTPGFWAKAAIVLREVLPTPSFVRIWSPRAARGPGWLVAAYLHRLVWVPFHAPKGLRAWLRARRVVAESRKV
ncbi:MAG TPA: nucleotidyltransferase family protein [Acidimicrobiales bacterium]|nr:nucleotidyltransferase family protein [Acidimicrobiales bacterium]